MSAPDQPSPAAGGALQRLIVTRPAEEAADGVARLAAKGWPAQALPLIHISEPRNAEAAHALHQQRARWSDCDAILFVSGAAVRHFFAADDLPQATAATRTRFWAPGPGTARALVEPLARLGLPSDRIDAPPADAGQFDSEALWPVVAPQLRPGCHVLIVRGASVADDAEPAAVAGNGRDWLIRQCEQAGARVQTVAAYERQPPHWSAAAHALRQQARAPGSVWLFSSSQAIDHLLQAEPGADWSMAQALVTHPRIAARAREAGFGYVVETRPALADVSSALESHWTRP